MARRTREELMGIVKTYIGDRSDDETMSLLEDISDSYPDGDDWKAKYDELDKTWRERYRERFFTNENGTKEAVQETHEESEDIVDDIPEENITYDDVWKED